MLSLTCAAACTHLSVGLVCAGWIAVVCTSLITYIITRPAAAYKKLLAKKEIELHKLFPQKKKKKKKKEENSGWLSLQCLLWAQQESHRPSSLFSYPLLPR